MSWFKPGLLRTARAIIIHDNKLLVMYRKRHSRISGDWIEYYSIPGGEINKNELPEDTITRELFEEMGIKVSVGDQVGHLKRAENENNIFVATTDSYQEPKLMPDSEEAYWMNENNQFIPMWVDIDTLTAENLRYYAGYLPLIERIAAGETIQDVVEIQ